MVCFSHISVNILHESGNKDNSSCSSNIIIEIQCMWNVKSKVIPVVTGENGTI